MSEDLYQILSLGARYWFALLGVLIVWRSFRWLRKDRKEKHRRLKQLPDAGMIGEMVVLQGSDELPEGSSIPVPREGTLGFLRSCDVVVPVEGVAGKHIDFTFQDGKGLLLFPLFNQSCQLDGQTLTHRTHNKSFPMHHGSRLLVGDALLRLRLFAGLETERHSAFASDPPFQPDPPYPDQQSAPSLDWQSTPTVYHQIPAAWSDASGRFQPIEQDWQPPAWQGYPPAEAPWQPPYPPASPPSACNQLPQEQSWIPPSPPARSFDQPPYSTDQLPLSADESFTPAKARQRRGRLGRRRRHEE